MAQLSRPQQIALAAVLMVALVGVVALRMRGGNPSEPAPSSPSSSASASAKAQSGGATSSNPATPSRVYHGAAPGVEGLTRDIAKAHGAVATSEQNAKQLQQKSAQASNEASSSPSSAPTGAPPSSSKPSASKTAGHAAPATPHKSKPTGGRPAQQLAVESELAHGKTVMLLFWEPKSSVDASVRSQVLALAASSKGKVAVHVARADQVGLFGPATEVAHVYQTPTILIVNPRRAVTTLTGLTDRFSLQQALREAERAH